MSKTKKTTGVLLYVAGHPYYGLYAFNLVLSIKGTSNLPVTLVTDSEGIRHLDERKLAMFDKIIKLPAEYLQFRGRVNYLKPKMYLNHLSPYDRTLYLDVDMMLFPKFNLQAFVDELEGVPFTMQNRGHQLLNSADGTLDSNFIIWANSKQIKEAHGLTNERLYNLSSELIYFEKGKESDKLFKEAQAIFENPKVGYVDFAGGVPDELPYTIAMAKQKLYPHIDTWRPIYWEAFDKVQPKEGELYQKYNGISLGGNILPKYTLRIYKNLSLHYGNRFGVTITWLGKNKQNFLPDRKTI